MRFINRIWELFVSQTKEDKNISSQDLVNVRFDAIKANIDNGVNKPVELSENEEIFIKELIERIDNELGHDYNLSFNRLSNKTLNAWYNDRYLGKIKLQGRKTYMQILNGLFGVEVIRDCTLEEYLKHIDGWIEYIKDLNEKLG